MTYKELNANLEDAHLPIELESCGGNGSELGVTISEEAQPGCFFFTMTIPQAVILCETLDQALALMRENAKGRLE